MTVTTEPIRNYRVAFAALAGAGLLMGLSTNLAKLAGQQGVTPPAYLAWSVSGAALLLWVAAFLRRSVGRLSNRVLEYWLVAGFLTLAAPNLLLFGAIPHVGAGFATIGLALPPLLTWIGALMLRMEAYDPWRAAGVGLALTGTVILASGRFATIQSPGELVWLGAVLLAPTILAAGNIYRTARWPAGATPDQLASGMLSGAAVLITAYAVLTQQADFPISLQAVVMIAFQALAFAVQYSLFLVLQKHGGPVFLSLLGSVAAFVGVPVAVMLLDETWPRGIFLAGLLIGLGVALTGRLIQPSGKLP